MHKTITIHRSMHKTIIIHRSMHKTITNIICSSKNTARRLSLSVSFDTLTVFLCVDTLCSCGYYIFGETECFHLEEIPTVWTSIIAAVTRSLVFDPFNRSHSSTAGLAVPSQQLPGGGTRPAGSKPTPYVQCVCPVTPTTTPIFAMTRLQKCKEINSVRFCSWTFLIRSKVFIHLS
jgi:hypothetical protein